MFEPLPLSSDVLPLLRAPLSLQRLNIGSLAASLAACTGAVGVLFAHGFHIQDSLTDMQGQVVETSMFASVACACAVSTFGYALLWGWILRRRSMASVLRWMACVPLAAMNAGTALAICGVKAFNVDNDVVTRIVGGFLAGATFGALVWVPALIATLLCFGLPLHWAEVAARKGLSSEDRGERMVAIFSIILAVVALAACTYWGNGSERVALSLLCIGAIGSGTVAAVFAHIRSRKRDLFLSEVRAGEHQGLAFVGSFGSENLVRVADVGSAYRVSRVAETLLEVQDGEVNVTARQQHHSH